MQVLSAGKNWDENRAHTSDDACCSQNNLGHTGKFPAISSCASSRFARPLRILLLSLFAAAIGILTVLSILSDYRNLSADHEQLISTAKRLILHERAFGSQTLTRVTEAISADTELQQAIENGDHQAIDSVVRNLLAEKHSNGIIAEFAIYSASQRLLYNAFEAGQPNQTGEAFRSAMTKSLMRRNNGIDFDSRNRAVVGVLKPWVANGKLLGYLQISINIERSLSLASAAADAQIIKICVLDDNATGGAGQVRYKAIGGTAVSGFDPQLLNAKAEAQQTFNTFYIQDSKVFLVRDLPIAIQNSGPPIKLLLTKDVTDGIWQFFFSSLTSILAAIGLGLVLWAAVHGLLFRAQSATDVIRARLEKVVADNSVKLEHSTTQLAEAQRIASIGSWERDVATNEIQASAEFFRILGIPPESDSETILKLTRQRMPAEDLVVATARMTRAIATCGTFEFEHRYQHANGSQLHLSVRGYVSSGSDGKAERLFGILHDVTWQRSAERQKSLFADVLESSLNEIYFLDADSLVIEYANRCALSNLGYQKDNLIGRTFSEISAFPDQATGKNPFAILKSAQKNSISAEATHRKRDGSQYPVDLKIRLHSDQGRKLFVAIANDVSQRVQRETETLEAKIRAERLAYFDPLTQLPNRAACHRDAIERLGSDRKPSFLIHVDIDGFKKVNDTFGHHAGDCCLEETGARLRDVCQDLGTPYRWGGDEFVILADSDTADVNELCERARRVMRQPMEFSGQRFWPTVSMGIALCPKDGSNFDTLLMNADLALYQSKANGKDRTTYFDRSLKSDSEKEARIERELREAVLHKQFTLVFQPQVNLRSQNITGVEALLRWQHPEKGELAPAEFLPVAEKTNLAPIIGKMVIDMALEAARSWLDDGLEFGRVAINVSQGHLASGELAEHFTSAMKKHSIRPDLVTAEVLESVFLGNSPSQDLSAISELYRLGMHIELDDFGTGYASLTHVADLPINGLKIDRSFTIEMLKDRKKEAVVNQLIQLARSLNIGVVCEGVETQEQYERLRMMGDFSIQGYLIARPMPFAQMTSWMSETAEDVYFVI